MIDQIYTIREAVPDDAASMLAHLEELRAEPNIQIITQPGESTITVEDEREFIMTINNSENSLFIVAVDADNNVIGALIFEGKERRAVRHVSIMSIGVAQEWREKGIGSALIARSIEWARSSDVVTRLELHVFADNERAIRVYEKHGFEVEGKMRRAIYRDGRFHDELVMGLLLD